jgi:hypothetical protein
VNRKNGASCFGVTDRDLRIMIFDNVGNDCQADTIPFDTFTCSFVDAIVTVKNQFSLCLRYARAVIFNGKNYLFAFGKGVDRDDPTLWGITDRVIDQVFYQIAQ